MTFSFQYFFDRINKEGFCSILGGPQWTGLAEDGALEGLKEPFVGGMNNGLIRRGSPTDCCRPDKVSRRRMQTYKSPGNGFPSLYEFHWTALSVWISSGAAQNRVNKREFIDLPSVKQAIVFLN